MGISSDGILVFGIDLGDPDEVIFPWSDSELYEDGFEVWWVEQSGFDMVRPEDNAELGAYYDAFFDWQREHRCPLDLTIYCSYDYPMYILSLPGIGRHVSRGECAEVVLPEVTQEQIQMLLDFCEKYNLEPKSKPTWLLASVYG